MKQRKVLISDFDGTMTGNDFFRLALKRLPEDALEPWQRFEEGRCSHFEALALIFARLRMNEEGYAEMIGAMEMDPGAASAVTALNQAGWQVEIASAGCAWYIERLLEQVALSVPVHANPGHISEEGALILEKPLGSPYYSPATGIDKSAVIRHVLAQGALVAYAGDGRPDLAPALLVAPGYRYARGWLAEELQRRGEPFRLFNVWHDIAGSLLKEKRP